MAEVLLSSEKFIKDTSSISDNTAARFILPALREAQEIGLRSILGDAMLDKLKELVASGEISNPANEAYNKLAYRNLDNETLSNLNTLWENIKIN